MCFTAGPGILSRRPRTKRQPRLWVAGWIVAIFTCAAPVPQAFAQRDLRDIPKPDPEAELAAMHIADGYEVNLYASDPAFAKPIHMNFDEQGRLWVASSRNYPQIEPGAKPSDQIVVLEDRDGDGQAEHHTVFAHDLLIPTGVLPGDGGVYVANSTELIHLQDTDGDGKADRRRTVLSGFGTEDTHHLLHTLRWGPDGWMYLNQSIYIHSHIETPRGVKHLDGGGIWRFDPGSVELQVLCKGFVNPWGHVIDPFGQSLVTDGAYFEGINYVFPDSVFVTSPGAERWLSGLNPGSPKHCGLEMISGGAMPEQMQGRLVTNDFRSHRVCLFEIARQGSGYRSVQLPELIRTEHVAFRPIDVKMGPDGAIYVADWYNPIIQHGEVDFRDPRRDTQHGRIWRITAKGHQPLVAPRYDQLDEEALCKLLRDSALWVRQFSRMELARRKPAQREAALVQFIDAAEDSREKELRQLEQLWVKLCSREVDSQLIDTLRQADDPRIRAVAIRYAGRLRQQLPRAADWLAEAVKDQDDQVVLEAVVALGQMNTLAAVQRLLEVASRPNQDQFLQFALWTAARSTEPIWLEALERGRLQVENDLAKLRLLADAATRADIARPLAELLRTGKIAESSTAAVVELVAEKAGPDVLDSLVAWITTTKDISNLAARTSYLEALGRITQARNVKPGSSDGLLKAALEHSLAIGTSANQSEEAALQKAYHAQLVDLAGYWRCTECVPTLQAWSSSDELLDDTELYARNLAALARIPSDASRQFVRQQAAHVNARAAPRAAALSALSIFDGAAAAELTLRFLAGLEASDVAAGESAVAALAARADGIAAIRKALPLLKDVEWKADGARTLIAALRNAPGSDDVLLSEVVTATHFDALGWKWSDEWAKTIIERAADSGDPVRGEAVYRQARLQCVRCHAIGQSGGIIGPNLVSLGGSSTPEYILQSLIDPNAKLKEGFQTLAVLTDDGRVISGLQRARTDTQLELVMADGTEQTLAVDSIESINQGRSIMPAGLVDTLSEQELVDLTRFLMELGRSPKFVVDTAPRVRNWSVLLWSEAAHTLLNRTSLDSAASDAAVLTWAPLASTVAGVLPLAEAPVFQPRREGPAVVFASFDVDCQQSGTVRFEFTARPNAFSMWLDGRPQPTPGKEELVNLTAGKHRVVLGLKVNEVGSTFGCQVHTDHAGAAVVELKTR